MLHVSDMLQSLQRAAPARQVGSAAPGEGRKSRRWILLPASMNPKALGPNSGQPCVHQTLKLQLHFLSLALPEQGPLEQLQQVKRSCGASLALSDPCPPLPSTAQHKGAWQETFHLLEQAV